ncbi:hypothetical protein BU23DRAFT_514540 [Bimuria novae-zelandiae CBS 107.79]|uniref:Regulator of phospholipase D SRF1 n=1 Tax=Bimuria novae-zelandiae CBS 107.79 TaxID=1447943 RepID=A0A6A5V5D0_9PLEO|nr:hypothetical protein BU23DRAFT_514540 [Bimuria novae-zelandiae CBS 107.79]
MAGNGSHNPMTEASHGASPFLHPLSQTQTLPQTQTQTQTQGHASSTTTTSTTSRLQPSPIPPTTSSLSLQRPLSATTQASEIQTDGANIGRKSHSQSVSSNPLTLGSSRSKDTQQHHDDKQHRTTARTLPPWVQAADDDEQAEQASALLLLLPRTPTSARPASHNYLPTPKSHVPGRRFDHAREHAPVTPKTPLAEQASKWQQFAKASDYDRDRPPSSCAQIVDDDWMKENMPDLEEPWQPMDQEEREQLTGFWLFSSAKRARFQKLLMNHAMVPLVVRLVVLIFSVLALALAGSIYHRTDTQTCQNNSSTWMAVIVDVVAIVYTMYITYDEYTSKPLGLRSHYAKMRLIFLDLAFIVFDSANLSLAFQALTDSRWACQDGTSLSEDYTGCPYVKSICTRQKALTATLLIALIAWLTTFTISIMRLIERVAR